MSPAINFNAVFLHVCVGMSLRTCMHACLDDMCHELEWCAAMKSTKKTANNHKNHNHTTADSDMHCNMGEQSNGPILVNNLGGETVWFKVTPQIHSVTSVH